MPLLANETSNWVSQLEVFQCNTIWVGWVNGYCIPIRLYTLAIRHFALRGSICGCMWPIEPHRESLLSREVEPCVIMGKHWPLASHQWKCIVTFDRRIDWVCRLLFARQTTIDKRCLGNHATRQLSDSATVCSWQVHRCTHAIVWWCNIRQLTVSVTNGDFRA